MVQTPADAAFPDMPKNALAAVEVDYQLPIAEMGPVLERLVHTPVNGALPVPGDLLLETKILEKFASNMTTESMLGELVPYSCPECGGPLWEIEGETVRRYRCNVGHAFTAQTLLAEQGKEIEQALWYALRVLEQRVTLLETLAKDAHQQGRRHSATSFQQRAAEVAANTESIRKLVQSLN
jgi:two-component system chemotaxis response regulator CheB